MFFGTTRRKVAATTAVQSMLRGLEATTGGIPEKVWSDAYALGWFSGYALAWANFYSRGARPSQRQVDRDARDSAEVLMYALKQVAPKERSVEILRRVGQLAKSNDAEFKRGSDAAMKTSTYGAGGDLDPNDPDLQAAKNIAEALAKHGAYATADRSAITGCLIARLFYDVILANRVVGVPVADRNRFAGELSEFRAGIMEAGGPTLGLTAVQAADVAARLYADTDGEVDLRSPRAALASRPALLTELTEAVIQLQKAGRQFEAPGTIMWVHTLRAELMPELGSSVKQMWSLVSKRGFLFVAEAETLYKDATRRSLPDNIIFRVVPQGFDDWSNHHSGK